MNSYYLTLVLKAGLEDGARKELLDSVKKSFAKTEKEDLWGARSLAYPIKRNTSGFYVHFEMEADPKEIKALDKNLKLEEDVLRYLLVRV